MNKFWGRNEHGSIPKFLRDNDQLLALNYENLCDSDYINKLFISDNISAPIVVAISDNSNAIISSNSDLQKSTSTTTNNINHHDSENMLNYMDLPEDLIICGNDLELGSRFFELRFNKELVHAMKNLDLITNLINRQSIIFEHIGKLIIDKCTIEKAMVYKHQHIVEHKKRVDVKTVDVVHPLVSDVSSNNSISVTSSSSPLSSSISSVYSLALDCTLSLLTSDTMNTGIYNQVINHLISIIFDICQENLLYKIKKSTSPPPLTLTATATTTTTTIISTTTTTTPIISSAHTHMLRRILCEATMNCLKLPIVDNRNRLSNPKTLEEGFRNSLASFYGLLTLAIHTGNASELLVAISQLMLILLRAEEWYVEVKAEYKLIAAVVNTTSSVVSNASREKLTTTTTTITTSKISHDKALSSKAAMKSKAMISDNSKTLLVKNTKSSSHKAAAAVESASNTTTSTASSSTNTTTAATVANEKMMSNQGDDNKQGSNTKAIIPAAVGDKELREQAKSIKAKMKKAAHDMPLIGDNMNMNGQEISAYYYTAATTATAATTTSSSTNSNSQVSRNMHSNQQKTTYNNKDKASLSNHHHNYQRSMVSNANSSNSNNNNKSSNYQDVMMMMMDSNTNGENNYIPLTQHNLSHSSPRTGDHDDKQKRNIKSFRDNLQNLLKVPKSMLKVMFESCLFVSSSNALLVPPSDVLSYEKDNRSTTTITSGNSIATSTTSDAYSHTSTFDSLHKSNFQIHNHNYHHHRDNGLKKTSSTLKTYVWSSGQNSYGELGLGDSAIRKTFAKVTCLDEKRIVGIGAGNEHSLFVTEDGKVYTAGYNDNGQCGMGSTQQVRQPTLIPVLEGEDISQVHVYNGCEHTLAVARDGRIFSFGYNYRGQLGLGTTSSESTPRPIRALLSRKVIVAACSYHHSFILCADGALFSCGRNDSGQLGHGDTVDKKTPQSVLNCPKGIISISCGQFHTLAATTSGVAYVCGKNDYGQLGMEVNGNVKVFSEITNHPEIDQVVQVCCGYYHSLLLSNTGVVVGFGRNDYGQLGLGHTLPKVHIITVISSLRDKGVRMLTAGCYHSVAITTNGMLYVFGRNNHGQLATGDQEERHIPHPVDDFVGQRIISVAAGFYHTIVLAAPIPVKSTAMTSSITSRLGVGVSDLVDASTLSAADIAEKLNPPSSHISSFSLADKSSSQQQSLLKDVMYLTGIEGNSKGVFVPSQFNIDKRSKVQNRDLLLFLMNHVDHLIKSNHLTATLHSDDYLNTKSNITSNGDEIHYPDDAIKWIGNLLRSVVIMLEICTSIIADTSGEVKLTLSYDDALTFMLKMIRIIATFIEEHANCLIFIILQVKMNLSDQFIKVQELDFMIDFFELKQKNDMKVNVTSLLSLLTFDSFKETTKSNDDHQKIIMNSFEALILFRNVLFKIFFSNVRKELERHNIYQEILNTIALCLAQSYELLLPDTLILSDFFLIMKKYAIIHSNDVVDNTTYNSNSSTTNPSANQIFQQSLCLRILTIICTNFCVFDEVIRLFQKSKLNALKVFQCIVNMYGYFSMYNLSKRTAVTATVSTSVAASNKNNNNNNSNNNNNNNSGIHSDIRRLLSVFEHCLSNFVKCSFPIIFVSTITSKKKNSEIDSCHTDDDDILELGVIIIRDVLTDAMRLVDYVLQHQHQHNQNHLDDILGQLRYGTIMPSVLPSILIYGISFAKYGCLILDIIPDLRCLVNKLQLINKPTVALNTNLSSINASAAAVATSISKSATGVVGSAYSGSSSNSKITDKRPGVSNSGPVNGGSIADRSKHLLLSTESSLSSSFRYGSTNAANVLSSPSMLSSEDNGSFDFQQLLTTADDLNQNKQRDYQQMHTSWWFRIVKLSTIYIAKMSSSLIYISSRNYPKKSLYSLDTLAHNEISSSSSSDHLKLVMRHDQDNKQNSIITRHDMWNFVSYPYSSSELLVKIDDISDYLLQDIDDKRVPDHVIELCEKYRSLEKKVDPMYRMLSQSSQSLFSANIFHLIEEYLLQVVIKFQGYSHNLNYDVTIQYFKLITRFTKSIHSHRSSLVSNSNNLSWIEILLIISNVVRLFCTIIMQGELKLINNDPLHLPWTISSTTSTVTTLLNGDNYSSSRDDGKTSDDNRNIVRIRWRKTLMVIICLNRWKRCVQLHLKKVALHVIDFISQVVDTITSNLTIVRNDHHLCIKILDVITCMNQSSDSISHAAMGFENAFNLLDSLTSNTLRCDVLVILLSTMKEKAEESEKLCSKLENSTQIFKSPIHVCCSASHQFQLREATMKLYVYLSKKVANNIQHSYEKKVIFTTFELLFLSNSLKVLQLLAITYGDFISIHTLSLQSIKQLLLILSEKQNTTPVAAAGDETKITFTTASTSNSIPPKKGTTQRERSILYQNSAMCVLSYLQYITMKEIQVTSIRRPYYYGQLLQLCNDLIFSLQIKRLEDLRAEEAQQVDEISKLNNKDNLSSTINSSSQKHANKDSNKKRCQDLITKPMEFCRTVEGFVMQGEKLLSNNNNKGVDFTIATWILIAKRPITAHSFITGKVNHNDAWPIVLLRNDGKLDILYGHNNELETFTTEASVPPCNWTHLSIIVEQKKIKVFINGILDCQVSTSKGNGKAVMFPLLVGTCPSNVRTRIVHVKDGFDGLLAQYKYYTRALSPIHVKFVYDNGPPETSDLLAKLIYQLMSTIKYIITSLNPSYYCDVIEQTAGIMHSLYVTDSCRRNRYAALSILSDILQLNSITNLSLTSSSSYVGSTQCINTYSIQAVGFLSEYSNTNFHHRVIAYLLKLIGICWAPTLVPYESVRLFNLDLLSTPSNSSLNHNYSSDHLLEEFLQFVPYAIVGYDNTQQRPNSSSQQSFSNNCDGAPSSSVVDKIAVKEETRVEICSQLLKVLINLSKNTIWNQAMSEVIVMILEKYCAVVQSSLSSSSSAYTISTVAVKLDVLAVSLLLGGGSTGPYIGAESTKTFFGDFHGKILNINKATNFAVLLGWNAVHANKQIVKVRLTDLVISDYQDCINLSSFSSSDIISILMKTLQSLSLFVPVILSDFLAYHYLEPCMFQLRVLLKAVSPVEVFIFSQLLHSLSCLDDNLPSCVMDNSDSSFKMVQQVLQQSAIASLKISDEVSHLGDFKSHNSRSVTSLWLKIGNFIECMPDKFTNKPLSTVIDRNSFYDYMEKYIKLSPQICIDLKEHSMFKEGRLFELINSIGVDKKDVMDNSSLTSLSSSSSSSLSTSSSLVGGHHSKSQVAVTCFEQCLVPDWNTDLGISIHHQLPWPESYNISKSKPSVLGDIDCIDALNFIYNLRSTIIKDSRKVLSLYRPNQSNIKDDNNRSTIATVDSSYDNATLWQSLLSPECLQIRLSVNSIYHHAVSKNSVTIRWWESQSKYLLNISSRIEMTRNITNCLKYLAVAILSGKHSNSTSIINDTTSNNSSSISSSSSSSSVNSNNNNSNNNNEVKNLFQIVDIFDRVYHSLLNWIEYISLSSSPFDIEVYNAILQVILPILSIIENDKIALQLIQLCLNLSRKLSLKVCNGQLLSREIMDLVSSNSFILLRARAQGQIIKYKTHNQGDSSALAFNLTQLVVSLELLQRQELIINTNNTTTTTTNNHNSNNSNSIIERGTTGGFMLLSPRGSMSSRGVSYSTPLSANNRTTTTGGSSSITKTQSIPQQPPSIASIFSMTMTDPPSISNIGSTSVDADLSSCIPTIRSLIAQYFNIETSSSSSSTNDGIIMEVAISSGNVSNMLQNVHAHDSKTALHNSNNNSNNVNNINGKDSEYHFETVYCGSSLRFVQSGLIPDCTYYIKCRAYYKALSLNWSMIIEFRTQKGILFTFDSMKCGPYIVLSHDNLTATYANDDTWSTILGTRPFSTGSTHWEIRINVSSTAYIFVGIASSSADLSSFLGGCGEGWGFIGEQALYHNREKVKVYGEAFSSGDIIGVTLDMNQGTLSFSKNHRNLGIAFDKIYGELYPAVAFYNAGQELEILSDGFRTNSTFESIPVSPSNLNLDDISVLNELILCIYKKQPLSYRLNLLISDHCNNWCHANQLRYKAVSGKEIFLDIDSSLLKRFDLIVGERVRTTFGVAEVAGSAFNKLWFKMNSTGEVWFYSIQQIVEGKTKNLFQRCSYEISSDVNTASTGTLDQGVGDSGSNVVDSNYNNAHVIMNDMVIQQNQITFDPYSMYDLIDPTKWSEEMDQVLLLFLQRLSENNNGNNAGESTSSTSNKSNGTTNKINSNRINSSQWSVTSQQVIDNYRLLQQQFSRIMLNSHDLSYRWGISGPKRKAVLARIGLLRYLNQQLELYLPFLITDNSFKKFVANQVTISDDFYPSIITIPSPSEAVDSSSSFSSSLSLSSSSNRTFLDIDEHSFTWPLISLSWDDHDNIQKILLEEVKSGPLHAIRRCIFTPLKITHFWEVIRKTTSLSAKTEDDYDYPDDLPHIKVNRLKSFRAKEASELLKVPGEDLMFNSMFCQLWRELRQHNDEKLRISYTHPMDDGQSRTFKVKFEGEGVDDYGGPYREIFQQICEELQCMDPSAAVNNNENNGDNYTKRPSSWISGEDKQTIVSNSVVTQLFKDDSNSSNTNTSTINSNNRNSSSSLIDPSPSRCFLPLLMPTPNWSTDQDCKERYRYMLHPASQSYLKMDLYHFMGQLVGIAIRSKITVDLAFPSYFWKYIVCEKLTEHDIASFDVSAYEFIKQLSSLYRQLQVAKQQVNVDGNTTSIMSEELSSTVIELENNLQEMISDLTWDYNRSDGQRIELIPGRSMDIITINDVEQYLVLYTEARLKESQLPMGMFRKGLLSIIPESALVLLTWEEIQDIVCGDRVIDIQRLRDNTEYDDDLSADDDHILLFWEVLHGFTEYEKSAFLRFVWARPTLPPKGVEFSQKMRVLTAVGEDAHLKPDQYLPKAHTCFFSINLPKYSTKELMSEKLLYAIFNCTEMDADFRTTETDVAGWDTTGSVLPV